MINCYQYEGKLNLLQRITSFRWSCWDKGSASGPQMKWVSYLCNLCRCALMLSALRAAERLWLCNMIQRKACQTPSRLQPHILIISRHRGRERCGSCDELRQQVHYQSPTFLHLWAAGPFRGHAQHNGFSLTTLETFPSIYTQLEEILKSRKHLKSFFNGDVAFSSCL